MFEIKYCPKCKDNKNFQNEYHTDWNPVRGYFIAFSPSDDICPYCKEKIKSSHMNYDKFKDILSVSTDERFIDTMINLYNNDIIEYELKMSQFRTQAAQIKQIHEQEESKPKCPKCGSTNITTGQRGYSLLTGFLGSNKTVNRCANCGYTWKP